MTHTAHHCPYCGEMCSGHEAAEIEAVAEDPSTDAVAVAAIEALEHVAVEALDAVTEVVAEEEETERVEAIMEAVEGGAEVEEHDNESEPEPEPEPEIEEEVEEAAAEPIDVAPPARGEESAAEEKKEGKQMSAFSRRHRR